MGLQSEEASLNELMSGKDHIWRSEAVAKQYLEGVRGAVPLAEHQIELVLFLAGKARPHVRRFLDLGCGDGILGRALFGQYPDAKGLFLDFSETMITAARDKLKGAPYSGVFIVKDYGHPDWVQAVRDHSPFDVVVSGFSIHHQPNDRKQTLYHEIYDLLAPGGLFLNLEHVASDSPWGQQVFDQYFIESLYQYQRRMNTNKTREEVALQYAQRPDREANILAPVEHQCQWLRDIGFENVACFFKILELALFGGTRPRPL